MRRICDSKEVFDKQSQLLGDRFDERGYPKTWFQSALDKVKHTNRTELLKGTQRKNKIFSVNYISTYTRKSYQIKSIVNKYWFILASDPLLKGTFEHPPMFTYKRSQNLANKLIKSDM